jgi:hypothetical protein
MVTSYKMTSLRVLSHVMGRMTIVFRVECGRYCGSDPRLSLIVAHSITASQHHSITASQHHSITASQHHSITASQHHSRHPCQCLLTPPNSFNLSASSYSILAPTSGLWWCLVAATVVFLAFKTFDGATDIRFVYLSSCWTTRILDSCAR